MLMAIPHFYPTVGGAERQCLKLSEALIELGMEVTVLTSRLSKKDLRSEIINSIPVTRLRVLKPIEANLPFWLLYLSSHRFDYDILHVHLLSHVHSAACFMAARMFQKPLVIKPGNSGSRFDVRLVREELRWPMRRLAEKGLFHAHAVVAICRAIRAELLEIGLPSDRIVEIPNGVEAIDLLPDQVRRENRLRLGLPEDACIVLRAGTLHPKKGLGVLLQAWEHIRSHCPHALLVSIGGASLPQELSRLTEEASNRVRFVTDLPEGITPYLQVADIFVLPSFAEGLSNALLEAQSAGLACLATRVGGNSEVIEEGRNGLLVDPGSVEQLAQSLRTLICSPSLRHALGQNAGLTALKYDIRKVAREYLLLYRRLLAPCG